jgi:hypothetical protein
MDKRAVEQELKLQRGIVGRMIVRPFRFAISNPNLGACPDQRTIRIGLQERNLFFQSRRVRPIIVILAADIPTTSQRDTAIERGRKPHVILVNDSTRGSRRPSSTAAVPSVEPSLMAISSKSVNVCVKMVSTASGRSAAPL